MDEDADFFTRRRPPSKKPKAKGASKIASGSSSKAKSAPNGATLPTSSATAASSSQSAVTARKTDGSQVTSIDSDQDEQEEEEEDEDTVLSSSDMDIASDDSDASAKRRAKRRKKKHTKMLPAWASQSTYRRPSQEPSSSSSNSVFFDTASGASGDGKAIHIDSDKTDSAEKANGKPNGRPRRVSLTPPPPPSPEKLYMAHELVNRTIASRFGTTTATDASSSTAPALSSSNDSASGSRRTTRSTRNSATPAFGQDVPVIGPSSVLSPPAAVARRDPADEIDVIDEQIHWDPDLARLMRGDKAKHIREQARREQQERDERRKQRELERLRQQQSLSSGSTQRSSQFARTQSAPQTRVREIADGGDESDDSVELVGRPIGKPRLSPRRTRSSTTSTAAAAASQPADGAIVIIDSDDDDDNNTTPTKANGTAAAANSPSPSPASAPEAAGETLGLTLQSKLGSIPVTVTPATLLSRIIQHFHEKKLEGSKIKADAIKVMFDGFAYNATQTVGEMDVEDGDQIELSWPAEP